MCYWWRKLWTIRSTTNCTNQIGYYLNKSEGKCYAQKASTGACSENEECQSGYCDTEKQKCVTDGQPCVNDNECMNGNSKVYGKYW